VDDLRFALIIVGIALVVVVYFISARGRRRDLRAGEFDTSGAWADSDADPLLDDLEATTINPLLKREGEAPAGDRAEESDTDRGAAHEPDVAMSAAATGTRKSGNSEKKPVETAPDDVEDSGARTRAPGEVRVLPGIDAVTEELDDAREPHIGSLDDLESPVETPPPATVKKKRGTTKKKAVAPKKSPGKSTRSQSPADRFQPEAHADAEPLAIVINIMALEGTNFPGVDVEEALQEAGLRFGEMQLYHYRSETQPEGTLPIFTALNMVKPGTLSPEEFPEMKTPGIALVLRLPGVEEPAKAFELMHKACQSISDYLGGTLCDQTRSHLTPQVLNHLREQITEYSRKLRELMSTWKHLIFNTKHMKHTKHTKKVFIEFIHLPSCPSCSPCTSC